MQKTAIVTGSTKGIGLAIGIELLKENYFVFFNYANDDDSANELAQRLNSNENYKNRFIIIKQKLENEEDVNKFYNNITQYKDKIDVLVLNAAITDRTLWSEVTWQQWERVMNINLNAPAALIRKFDKNFQTGGNIVFIGSLLGKSTHAVSISYSVSKAAVHGLTKALVKEYCERNIRINAILPGFVETQWQKNKPEAQRKRICDKVSLHRFAKPEEISKVVIDVINSTYINGALIDVNGGYDYR